MKKKALGMSLVELLVGAGIFVMVMAISASAGMMIFKGKAKIEYTNQLYSETRFMMERIIRDVRINTIDYSEYFSQNLQTLSSDGGYEYRKNLSSTAGKYGENAGLYEMFFYYVPDSDNMTNDVSNLAFSWKNEDRSSDINMGVFNTNADDISTNDNTEFTLLQSVFSFSIGDADPTMGIFLISSDGLTKTLYRYKTETVEGAQRGFIEMAKMKLVDTNTDANIVKNEWIDYRGDISNTGTWDPQFVSVTPPTLSVTNFSFILSPRDDPKKSFAKAVDEDTGITVQIQPHVVIKISAQLSEKQARGILGTNNEFTLQSSASSRIFHNVTFPRQ